jgi:hypothetical protein
MALACMDISDVYRLDTHLLYFPALVHRRAWYLWAQLVSYGVLLIAPAAALLFSGVGQLGASARRIKVFLLTTAITLPFILVACLPHTHGGQAVLYVAGPVASILASLAYKSVSFEKSAFWSSLTLLGCRIFVGYSRLDYVYTPLVGSYVRWGELEFAGLGLAFLCASLSAILLLRSTRVARMARKTFAA